MNYLAVQNLSSQFDAALDGEEFSVAIDVWKTQSAWLNSEVPVDFTKLSWEQADEKFFEAVAKAEALLRRSSPSNENAQNFNDNDNQLELAIVGSFTPSAKLIDAWKENASQFVERKAALRVKTLDASVEFSRMLKRLLAAFAQEKRYAGEQKFNVADTNGNFNTYFQLDVSERFLLVPQKSAAFFDLLHQDILASCRGLIYSGGWGSFIRRPDNSLVLELLPPKRVKREGFVKARETRK